MTNVNPEPHYQPQNLGNGPANYPAQPGQQPGQQAPQQSAPQQAPQSFYQFQAPAPQAPAPQPAVPQPQRTGGVGYYLGAIVGGAVVGALVAFLGTLVHRQWYPWLLIAALAVTVIGGLWMVLWRRVMAGVGYLTAWSIVVLALAGEGPGGDVLVPGDSLGAAPGSAGVIWLNVGMVCALVALLALLPFGKNRKNGGISSGEPRPNHQSSPYSK